MARVDCAWAAPQEHTFTPWPVTASHRLHTLDPSHENEVLIACLEEGFELLDGKPDLFDDGPQCSFRHLGVIGHNDSPVRLLALAKHNMTAFLTVLLVSDPSQSCDNLTSRHAGKRAQTVTSTISSSIGGGIGSS